MLRHGTYFGGNNCEGRWTASGRSETLRGPGNQACQLNPRMQVLVTDAELRGTVALGLGTRSRGWVLVVILPWERRVSLGLATDSFVLSPLFIPFLSCRRCVPRGLVVQMVTAVRGGRRGGGAQKNFSGFRG